MTTLNDSKMSSQLLSLFDLLRCLFLFNKAYLSRICNKDLFVLLCSFNSSMLTPFQQKAYWSVLFSLSILFDRLAVRRRRLWHRGLWRRRLFTQRL